MVSIRMTNKIIAGADMITDTLYLLTRKGAQAGSLWLPAVQGNEIEQSLSEFWHWL